MQSSSSDNRGSQSAVVVPNQVDVGASGPRDRFAFALKDQLLKERQQGNLCYSPLSIQLCLSMLLNGTAGDSSAQLRRALSLGKQPLATINDANYTLVAALLGVSFTCANSIWLGQQIEAKPAFQSAVHDFYRGAFFGVPDFGPATVQRINDWTSDNTKGRIPSLVSALDPRTSVVLVNALTFDGKWSQPFEKSATKPGHFKLQDGSRADVLMMHQQEDFAYYKDGGTKILAMNYAGNKFSMLFILPPPKESASAYLSKLSESDFRKMTSSVGTREVDVALPRFELRSSYILNRALASLGMKKMFTHTDLSNIADALKADRTFISQVVHQTYMKVYEEGTEAAAGFSVAAGTAGTGPPDGPATFYADRPFVYALMHNDTQAIVFLGVVNDPRN